MNILPDDFENLESIALFWTKKEQTTYKIKYVKHYVERWALIQAERSTINKINFVDCMCNAGIYKDGDFCTALEVISAFNVLAEKPDYQAKEFVVYLNDISADRIETFKSIVSKTMCLRKICKFVYQIWMLTIFAEGCRTDRQTSR